MRWAVVNGLGRTPAEVRAAYSMPLLTLLFDADWWERYTPPPDVDYDGEPRGKRKVYDAREMTVDQIKALFQ